MTTNPASNAAGKGHNQGGNTEAGDSPAAPEVAIPIAEDDEILRDSSHAEAKSRAEGAAGGPIFRRLSRKLTRPDSLDVESMRVRGMDNAAQVSAQNKTFTDIENISSIVKELVGRVPWAGVKFINQRWEICCAESIDVSGSAAGVPEHRSGVWRPGNLPFVCVQQHLHEGHQEQPRRVGRALAHHLHHRRRPPHQIHLHRPSSQRQRRR